MVVVVTGGYGATAKGIIQHFKKKAKAVVGTLRNLDPKWKEKDGVYYTKCDLSETDQIEGCVEILYGAPRGISKTTPSASLL